MSGPTRMTSTAIATIWRSGTKDEFGRSSFEAPVKFNCCFDYNNGRKYTSSRGIELVPSVAAWCEVTELSFLPKEGDFIVKGDHTSGSSNPTSIAGALPIKDVAVQDCSLLREADDIRILC